MSEDCEKLCGGIRRCGLKRYKMGKGLRGARDIWRLEVI